MVNTNGCDSADLYNSLGWCKGKTVLPGIRTRVYFAKKSNIVTWPKLPDTVAEGKTMGQMATYVGDFVLAADKKWNFLDILTAESPVTSESQGDMPARSFINKVTLKHAGVEEEATGFARQANADDLVYLVQQRNGKFRLVGNEMFETDTKPSQELVIEATVLFLLICAVYFIGDKKGNPGGALQCVSFITYSVFYFYGVNILRNTKQILSPTSAAYKVVSFLYYVLSVEFIKNIPYLSNYNNQTKEVTK